MFLIAVLALLRGRSNDRARPFCAHPSLRKQNRRNASGIAAETQVRAR